MQQDASTLHTAAQEQRAIPAHPAAARSAARGDAAHGPPAPASDSAAVGPSHSTAVNCRSTWRRREGCAPAPTAQISEGAPLAVWGACARGSG